MRGTFIPAAVLPLSLWTLVTARIYNSLSPEDPFAFPKYRVAFLNGLPLLNETAQRWIQNGLRGGELEFLDQPWQEDAQWRTPPVKSIDGGSTEEGRDTSPSYRLELMRMGPRSSYLCLIPPPPPDITPAAAEESTTEVTPVHSWSLLQPLSGSCLYHKQGWFTYAYCHNSHVRQFHELQRPNQQRLGEYKPEEDTEWEAYTLGRAPPTPEPGADLTVAQEAAIAANVELARHAGSRYLVQRWGDGTYCEKIGRRREIEIQFHCSMTMTDSILFVKETQTCHYVVHIATPRLCSEPGFRSRRDSHQETYVRCREIVSPADYETIDRALPEREYPLKAKKRPTKPVIAPPPAAAAVEGAQPQDGAKAAAEKMRQELKVKQNEMLRKALEKIVASGEFTGGEFVFEDDEGEQVVTVIEFPEDGEDGFGTEGEDVQGASLEEILRAVGYDVKPKAGDEEQEKGKKKKEEQAGKQRDEL
ncbi:hypothetical protein BDW22DRAFT_1340501 [Trametopsis cervina]|nr:hypothetical protein BDW22DRAFT_1340501 [Trametopsis cervina]